MLSTVDLYLCLDHCVVQTKSVVELCCLALPLNSRWHIQTCESQTPALHCPAWVASPNCVRNTAWRMRKQTQNCAALPCLSTRADIFKRESQKPALLCPAWAACQCAPCLSGRVVRMSVLHCSERVTVVEQWRGRVFIGAGLCCVRDWVWAALGLRARKNWPYKVKKGKAVPLQAWSGPEGSGKLRFPDFHDTGTGWW